MTRTICFCKRALRCCAVQLVYRQRRHHHIHVPPPTHLHTLNCVPFPTVTYLSSTTHTHTHPHARTHARTHTHTHTPTRTHARTHAHSHTHARTHARTHAHTHTYSKDHAAFNLKNKLFKKASNVIILSAYQLPQKILPFFPAQYVCLTRPLQLGNRVTYRSRQIVSIYTVPQTPEDSCSRKGAEKR